MGDDYLPYVKPITRAEREAAYAGAAAASEAWTGHAPQRRSRGLAAAHVRPGARASHC